MKKRIFLLVAAIVLIGAGMVYYYGSLRPGATTAAISSFADCAARYPIQETYPAQCTTPDGRHFVQDIGNVLEKDNLIRLNSPQPGDTVKSPLTVSGEAVGPWYFEAVFPVKLKDARGAVVAEGQAQAQSDWMTTSFVPFQATLTFTAAAPGPGELVLEKDNPSGDPTKDDALIIPVVIAEGGTTVLPECKPTGCSKEICSDQTVVSACVYLPQFACYKTATCARQPSGSCGWTPTPALAQCLAGTSPANQAPEGSQGPSGQTPQ